MEFISVECLQQYRVHNRLNIYKRLGLFTSRIIFMLETHGSSHSTSKSRSLVPWPGTERRRKDKQTVYFLDNTNVAKLHLSN